MSRLSILFATSEMAPWVKTGGLGDVAAALPAALHRARHDVRVLIPAYPAMLKAFPQAIVLAELPALAPSLPASRLLGAEADGLPLILLDCPALFDRPGSPYLDAHGDDWVDNGIRFGLLSRVAALLGQAASPLGWQPDVVHVNDWQTALAPAWLHYEGGAASVVTVHNIAFQGNFAAGHLSALGLPEQAWHMHGVEYHGQLSFLKAGLQLATLISTVSPTYAREIQDEHFGYGLAPLLRHRAGALRGILNGVDTAVWNPASDPALAAPYAANRLAAKRENKRALQQEMGLDVVADRPLFGIISRLTHQKGLDLVLTLGEGITHLPAQLAILGSGDKVMEAGFSATRRPPSGADRGPAGVRRSARPPHRGRRRLLPDAVALRALRPQPDVQPALRHAAHRPRHRRPGRYRDRRQRGDARRQDSQRLRHRRGDAARPVAGARARHALLARPPALAAHPAERHAPRLLLGTRGPRVREPVSRRHRRPRLKIPVSEIVIIAAVARNRVIGKDNRLLWNIPEDMAHFKALTAGHTVVMGRKTWESLPPRFRPLPGRRNIVISRQADYAAPGAEVADSLENALKLASTWASADSMVAATVFIIGGEQIYTQAMAVADRLEITEVDLEPEGDAWFPEIAAVNWEKTAKTEGNGFAFVTYRRRAA